MDFVGYFGIAFWYFCFGIGVIFLLFLVAMIVIFIGSAMASFKEWVHPKLLILYNKTFCWWFCESICETARKLRTVKPQFQKNITIPTNSRIKIFFIGGRSLWEPIEV
jgi:hypothetical protein